MISKNVWATKMYSVGLKKCLKLDVREVVAYLGKIKSKINRIKIHSVKFSYNQESNHV